MTTAARHPADETTPRRDGVSYWHMRPPQVDAPNEALSNKPSPPASPASSSSSSSSSDSDDIHAYELLHPSDDGTRALLAQSPFYAAYVPPTDRVSETLLRFCGSFPVRMGPAIAASLVHRFTDAGFNWRNKTLQSFLEVVCWASATYAAYSLYHDLLIALQVGTFVGALMSIGDEVVLQFVRGLAREIRNQQGGSELLQTLGFDVPLNGKAPTNGREIELIKTLVFGYLGVVAVRSLWQHFHDVTIFALLSAAVGVAFVVTAEFACLWLPTRRVGLTLQSRFTTVRQNWQEHFTRSLVELLAWVGATSSVYYVTQDFWFALRVGTLVAVAVCLASGLEDLPDIVSSDDDASQASAYAYWQDQRHGDVVMTLADAVVKVQDGLNAMGVAVQAEAMNMYENWSQ